MHLILASKSIGRKKLLKLFNVPFDVIESDVDEDKIHAQTPFETIKLRAKRKAESVARKYINKTGAYLIISADSDADLNGKIVGKARDEKDATNILQAFSDKTHDFYTGVYVIQVENGKITKTWETADHSKVTMRKLTKEDIDLHLSLSEYKRYAGAYALFASPVDLISKVEGSLTNVVGLPLDKLIPILKENNLLKQK